MRRTSLLLGVGLLTCGILVAASLWADEDDPEQEIALGKVPAKVKAAAEKAVKGLRISAAEVEAVLIYEVEGTADGKRYEVEVTAEGKVLHSEVEDAKEDKDDNGKKDKEDDEEDDEGEAEHELAIPLSAVPKAVSAAAAKAVKGIKLAEAEVEAVLVYELKGKAGEREHEVEVTADGTVIEVEGGDDDD